MNPDRTNYEIWLIDYLDGNLDPRQVEQLMSFLIENPAIKKEFSEISQYSIIPGDTLFCHKNSLKKSVSDISESLFEYLCVAASENDLSSPQATELNEIIAENSEKRKTYELIKKLKLVAPQVDFRKKYKLRKLTVAQRIVRYSAMGLSAAATVALLISLFFISLRKNTAETAPVAIFDSKDSMTIVATPVKTAGNVVSVEDKETQHTPLTSIQKSISEETIPINTGSAISDSTSRNTIIKSVLISKIDFKQNVSLVERSFAATLAAINTSEVSISGTVEKHGINEFIAKIFREKILKSKDQEYGQLKAYEIADAGIAGLNTLLGWQMSLKKNKDAKGTVKSVYFSSKFLKFNAPVKKV
jgi:hypothetical protein